MMEISFSRVTFSQANRYIFIVQSNKLIKRNDMCIDWTSAPFFHDAIKFQQTGDLTIKACAATYQKKLTVMGSIEISLDQILKSMVKHKGKQSNIDYGIYQQQKQLTQLIQGKRICVGRCHIRIIVSHLKNLKSSKSSNEKQTQSKMDSGRLIEGILVSILDYLQNIEEFQLKQGSQLQTQQAQNFDQQQQKRCEMRFIIHCGFGFYLNSSFTVNLKWSGSSMKTKPVRDKINPIWAQNISMRGNDNQSIQLCVTDQKNNRLEWLKIYPKDIRIMFPYHLKLVFRQQIMGDVPEIYVTLIREDKPKYSIIEKQIGLFVNPINQKIRIKENQFVLIQSSTSTEVNSLPGNSALEKENFAFPKFFQLNLRNKISFQLINKHLDENGSKWSLLLPVAVVRSFQERNISVLKSLINKSLDIFLLQFYEWKKVFQLGCSQPQKIRQGLQIIDQKEFFENNLKQIYYHNQKFCLKKRVQISNADDRSRMIPQVQQQKISEQQKWRIMSYNYRLRQKMVRKAECNINNFKKLIQQKGDQLVKLKKVLGQVKNLNSLLKQKEATALVQSQNGERKQRLKVLQGKYNVQDIIGMLFEKQGELQHKKKSNDQIRARMQSLSHYQDDLEQLNKSIVTNAHRLHEQLGKIRKMNIMKEVIPKQRQVISKLQKIFEQRQLDRQMNHLLQRENSKLQQMQKKKRHDLQVVYQTIAQKQKLPLSYKQKCQQAEQQLRKLNSHYVQIQNII